MALTYHIEPTVQVTGREIGFASPNHTRGQLPALTTEQAARFWSRVTHSEEGMCWLWTAGRMSDGYGMFKIGKRNYGAHRIAYLLVKGAPPLHLEIDHLCSTPPCVNPAHLEAVTHKQNMQRAHVRTVCKRGHPRQYRKACNECANEKRRERYAQERGR